MPVSTDLKALITRLDGSIADRVPLDHVDQAALRRDLDRITGLAEQDEAEASAVAPLLGELTDGLERAVESLQRLERRARMGAGK